MALEHFIDTKTLIKQVCLTLTSGSMGIQWPNAAYDESEYLRGGSDRD